MSKKSILKFWMKKCQLHNLTLRTANLSCVIVASAAQFCRKKQRVNIYLGSAIIEYFKAKAGGRGYPTLINDALKQVLQGESIEATIKKTIREELRKNQ